MSENITGLVKIIGITVLLLLLWGILASSVPEKFLSSNNIENLLRRTALYGILGIGVAFVIISAGIDLSIGSLLCLCGCLFAVFLQVSYEPLESTDVYQVAADSMIVANREFDEGETIWYYKDRRNHGTLEITSVETGVDLEGRSLTRLRFSGTQVNPQDSTGGSIAAISRAIPITAVGDQSVTVESTSLGIGKRDKVKMVHPNESTKERAVVGIDGTTIQLDSSVSGINDQFFVVPIKRSALMSIPVAVLAVLGIAILIGLIHGLLITKLNQQPFIITLCGLLIYRGLARWLTNDQPVGFIEYSDSLGMLATGRWVIWNGADGASFGIPYSFFLLLGLTILAIIFLNFTVWGRYLLALGRNEEAARYSGINTNLMIVLAYVICAVMAGLGGIMFAIDSNSVPPSSFGNFFELYAIAAAVLGGCSLRGGEGSILGVVVGTALMQTLYNSIVLLNIPDELEFTIIGAVILIGVIGDEVVRRFASGIRSKS